MKLQLVRKQFGKDSTIGELMIDGKFQCFILEDKVRDNNMDGDNDDAGEGKIYGQTAIPYGKVNIVLNPHGSIHESYLKKDWPNKDFKNFYKGMLMVVGVNGFKRLHIHIGTKIEDTLGCLLTGSRANTAMEPYTVSESTTAYMGLYKKVIDPLLYEGILPLEIIKG